MCQQEKKQPETGDGSEDTEASLKVVLPIKSETILHQKRKSNGH
jgi:hypothetical protein